MLATLQLRRWLRRRVVRPIDRWLTPSNPPAKYPIASRQAPCQIHQRLLKRLGRELERGDVSDQFSNNDKS